MLFFIIIKLLFYNNYSKDIMLYGFFIKNNVGICCIIILIDIL